MQAERAYLEDENYTKKEDEKHRGCTHSVLTRNLSPWWLSLKEGLPLFCSVAPAPGWTALIFGNPSAILPLLLSQFWKSKRCCLCLDMREDTCVLG